jgi:hypothetical protein
MNFWVLANQWSLVRLVLEMKCALLLMVTLQFHLSGYICWIFRCDDPKLIN